MNENNMFAYKNPLWNRIEKELLPFVNKPGRYIGNELNAIIKDHKDRFKVALVFPDIYEIGMSYLGMQILYNIINSRDDCLAERVFQVWPDMEKLMQERQIPLFTLETSSPLEDFDLIGISVTYEMHAAGVLNILELAGIPFRSKDRDESYPLIIAGGPAIINPEPLAEFFDAMVIGDGEEVVNEILDSLIAGGHESKQARLRKLADIKSVYVPSFYKAEYDKNGFKNIVPIAENIPEKIKVRTCMKLDREYYPSKPIVPFIETTHDRLAVEIMRGCVNGCRFCQAGYQYRPRRPREAIDIHTNIQTGYRATGFDNVTLLSLSSTDYPDLDQMISSIMPFMRKHKISLSLPSLRPGSLSSTMLEHLKDQRKSGITFAPEAGTQRMRNMMGKYITDEEIYDGIKKVFDNDWTLVKLYFMVGLPGETENDIYGIVNMIKQASSIARSKGGKRNINVTISPFAPKPGTPWQWEAQLHFDEVQRIFDMLKQQIHNRNVALKLHDPRLAVIEGIMGRGDRRMADVVEKAYQLGARLDGWSEHFDFSRWEQALTDCDFNIDDLLSVRFVHQQLPWEHIDKGIVRKFLLDERERSLKGDLPPGAERRKERLTTSNAAGDFGRAPKKKAIASAVPTKSKIRVRYSRGKNMRFYSHLDMIRLFMRALRRADLPVSFSQGYHPHMRLSFGPPLPIGYSSEAEYLDIQLESPFEKGHLSKLNESMPSGIEILATKLIYSKVESLTKLINCALYSVELESLPGDAEKKINELLNTRELSVVRIKGEEKKQIEVGHLIHDLNIEDHHLNMLLGVSPDGYIRPAEVLTFGLGMNEIDVQMLVFHRVGQYRIQGVRKADPFDMV